MAEVVRELVVQYDDYIIDETLDRFLDGKIRITDTEPAVTVTFDFMIQKDSEADFAAEIDLIHEKFSTPRKRLLITQGSETLHDWNPELTVQSGFNAAPTITKEQDEGDTGRSRRYTIEIVIDKPAEFLNLDGSNPTGRRDSTVDVNYDESRIRTLTVTGTYTALPNSTAVEVYEAQIPLYISAIQSDIGGTWDIADETYNANDTNTLVDFTYVTREIIYPQSSGSLDNPAIVNQTLNITPAKQAPGDDPSSGAQHLIEVEIAYDASIDHTVTTNLTGLYTGTIRPFLLSVASGTVGGGSSALVEEVPTFINAQNRISVRMRLLVVSGSSTLSFTQTTETFLDNGITLVPVWTANPFDKYEYQGPFRLVETITTTSRVVQGGGGRANRGGAITFGILGGGFRPGVSIGGLNRNRLKGLAGNGAGFKGRAGIVLKPAEDQEQADGASSGPIRREISSRETRTPLRLGIAPNTIDVVDITTVEVFETFTEPSSDVVAG